MGMITRPNKPASSPFQFAVPMRPSGLLKQSSPVSIQTSNSGLFWWIDSQLPPVQLGDGQVDNSGLRRVGTPFRQDTVAIVPSAFLNHLIEKYDFRACKSYCVQPSLRLY